MDLVIYYLTKKIFCLVDQWLLIYVAYRVMSNKKYLEFIAITIFGLLCMHSVYYNIEMIENEITTGNEVVIYSIKRLFLMLDEWLLYLLLIKIYCDGCYKLFLSLFCMGFVIIYNIYYKLDIIENRIINIDQSIFIVDLYLGYITSNFK